MCVHVCVKCANIGSRRMFYILVRFAIYDIRENGVVYFMAGLYKALCSVLLGSLGIPIFKYFYSQTAGIHGPFV